MLSKCDVRRLAAACAAAGILAGLFAAGQLTPTAGAAPVAQRGGDSPCSCPAAHTVSPSDVRLCDTSTVTLTVRPTCPGSPIHIVFIIDEVYKPGYSNPEDRTSALRAAVQRLELDENPHIRIGIVWMQSGGAVRKLYLSNDTQRIIRFLDIPTISRFAADVQCFDCGYREAVRILDEGKKEVGKDVDVREITLLAPLGVYTSQAAPGVLEGAQRVKGRRATSITTCFAWTHCDPVLRQAASEARLYLGYGEGNRLAALLHDVVRTSLETFIRRVTIHEQLPVDIRVLTATLTGGGAYDADQNAIVWEFTDEIANAYTLTYQVAPQALGVFAIGEGSLVEWADSHARVEDLAVPSAALTVSMECPPPPTATPPPTPTATEPPSPTPVPTSTPVPTNTPIPLRPVYLPVALREMCTPKRAGLDVALVLDISTSMRDVTPEGGTKLAAAETAAEVFLDGMNLSGPDGDRVAIVGFNREAWIASTLTSDRAGLVAAIDGLGAKMAEFTRLDLALETGGAALAGSPSDRDRALILLTDGLPNQVPYAEDGTMETTILRIAQRLKGQGIVIHTVGVGRASGPRPEINPALLRAIASWPDMYHAAPKAGDLAGIYQRLSRIIPCGGARFWPVPR